MRLVLPGCGVMAVPFLRYFVLLFSYCLKQFVYILIKRNQSDSERVCFVVVSGVVFGVFVAGCWSLMRCLTDIRSDMAKRQLLKPNQGKALTFHLCVIYLFSCGCNVRKSLATPGVYEVGE